MAMRKTAYAAAAAGLIAVPLAGCGTQKETVPKIPPRLSAQQLVKSATPAIVAIKGRTKEGLSAGTGFLISPHEILTAAHVVLGARNLKVRINGNTQPVRVKGVDVCGSDTALLELSGDAPGVTTLPLAQPGPPEANARLDLLSFGSTAVADFGQWAMTSSPLTVANPQVPNPTLGPSFAPLHNLIQVQGVVQRGASGGALLTPDGEVAGMIVMGETQEPQAYAVSTDDIRRVLPQLRAGSRSTDLGLDYVPLREMSIPSLFARDPDYGAYPRTLGRAVARLVRRLRYANGLFVNSAADGSPAWKRGIRYGDVITEVNGVRVGSLRGVCGVLQSTQPGDQITISGVQLNSGTRITDILKPWKVTVRTRR